MQIFKEDKVLTVIDASLMIIWNSSDMEKVSISLQKYAEYTMHDNILNLETVLRQYINKIISIPTVGLIHWLWLAQIIISLYFTSIWN